MNYSAFSIVILGLIIGYIFYDELYNKNVENVKNKENLSPLEIVLIILASSSVSSPSVLSGVILFLPQ